MAATRRAQAGSIRSRRPRSVATVSAPGPESTVVPTSMVTGSGKSADETTSVPPGAGVNSTETPRSDGQGEGHTPVVVGVVTDQVDPSRSHRASGLGQRHAPL